jgi:uncharacterized membrane protein YdjX (TVP38/TMEM64 family)
LASVLASIFLLAWGIFGQELEATWDVGGLVASFEASENWAWLLGIVLLIADLILPIPGTIVMSALGAVYGFWFGGFLASLGSFLAGIAGYGVGRFFKEEKAKHWLGERDFEKGRALFEKGGALMIALSRAVPILPEVLACMAGLLRMPFRIFCVAALCGSVPMGFLFAWIGTLGRASPTWGFAFSLGVPALLWSLAAWGSKKTS